MKILLTCIFIAPLWFSPVFADSQIKPDEEIIFFPGNAYQKNDKKSWKVTIHGWVFEPASDIKRVFTRLLQLKPKTTSEKKLYQQRSRYFLVDNERGKVITIHLNGKTFKLPPSKPNGHFSLPLILDNQDFGISAAKNTKVEFRALLNKDDHRVYNGRVQIVSASGLSVISDIDDTIKISNVLDKKELMSNTFLRPFKAAPGMAALYRKLQKQGAVFHYVSASPWQLYPPLEQFREKYHFPAGSFHLKSFRWRDRSFSNIFKSSVNYKMAVIEGIIKDSPGRQFILVGDSGEHDPEIYGVIARRYPNNIRQIWIRNIKNEKPDSKRLQQAFRKLRPTLWRLFPANKLNQNVLIKGN